MLKEILETLLKGEYQHYGLRVASKITDLYSDVYVADRPSWHIRRDLRVGQIAPRSHVWRDNDTSSKLLPGTSALEIDIYRAYDHEQACGDLLGVGPQRRAGNGGYSGDQIVLLGSDHAQQGNDRGEIVMRRARVLATWTRAEFVRGSCLLDCGYQNWDDR